MKIHTVTVYPLLKSIITIGEKDGKETFKKSKFKSIRVDNNFHFILNDATDYILCLIRYEAAEEVYTFMPLKW